jgi:hypothetical protein
MRKSIEAFDHRCGDDMWWRDNKEPVTAVTAEAIVPEASQDCLCHSQGSLPDKATIIISAGMPPETYHVREQHCTVFPVQTAAPLQLPRGERLRKPVIDLTFYDVKNILINTDEGGEIIGRHDQRLDHVTGDYGGRPQRHPKCCTFANQLPWAAFCDDAFSAALLNTDLHPTAEDNHDMICLLAFPHKHRAGSESPLMGC